MSLTLPNTQKMKRPLALLAFCLLFGPALAEDATTTAVYTSPETGFALPELSKGHAIPLVTIDDILKCPYIQPSVRAPDDGNATSIYLSLTIDRLLDIRDIEETISISATMYLQWGVYNCKASYTAQNVTEAERVIATETDRVWHPTIMFANSSDDVYMQSTQFGTDMQILYQPSLPYRTLYFYWTQIGTFTSKCELDLRKFPFDEQTCDFTFLMKEPYDFIKFAGAFLREPAMSPNNQWMLRGSEKEIGTTPSTIVRNGVSSYVAYQLTFARNPSYHVCNLLAPCYVLISLVLGSFLMPPEKPDRPAICCTILLAFVVAQSDVLQEVPKNSQRILLAEYILLFTGLTGAVTMYDMLMCGFCCSKGLANKPIVPLCGCSLKMRVVRGFDIVAFLLACDFLAIINLYACVIIFNY